MDKMEKTLSLVKDEFSNQNTMENLRIENKRMKNKI